MDTLLVLAVTAVTLIGWLCAFIALADARYWRKRAMYYMDESRAVAKHYVAVKMDVEAETDRLCNELLRDDPMIDDADRFALRRFLREGGRGRLS